jgi:UDP-N-acetylglucosamine acyltransferase
MRVHATAFVDEAAEIGDVEIGPFAVIESGVSLADGVVVGPHAVIHSGTKIGPRTRIDAHAVLGGAPQDRKHDLTVLTRLEIGADNVFREFSTAHRGTSHGPGLTQIGEGNYFMASSHVAHDCVVGDGCMFANSAAIAGHVQVGNGAILGGLSAVHQYSRIGRLAMVGGGAMCAQDVPPFSIAQGDRARLYGLNITGLRRGGIDAETVSVLKDAWRTLFVSDLPRRTAISRVREQHGTVEVVQDLLAFLQSSERGVCRAGLGQ